MPLIPRACARPVQLLFVCVYRSRAVTAVTPKDLYAIALAATREEHSAKGAGALEVRRGGLKLLMALVAVVPDLFGNHLPPASGVQLVRSLRAIENMDTSAELRELASALLRSLESK